MDRETPIPPGEWETIVRNVPVVSVDLVVRHDGDVLLGKRTNEPARGEWFVPGGTVFKHERLEDAVHRVARDEVGVEITVDRLLGVYEHFYDEAELDDVGGKHYVPVGFLVTAEERALSPDDQHAEVRWFTPPFDSLELHPYVRAYLRDAGVASDSE